MLSSFSSNAILAKARAMYGQRLKTEDYRALLACKTVGEVAGYLKSQTAYGSILAGINEIEVHRLQLETKLRQKLFDDYAALCRYEISVGEHFSQYLITRTEIEQILHSILLLNADMPEEYLFSMPMYLSRHTRIDLSSLSRIKSFDDLLSALAHTPYRALLEPFRPAENDRLHFTEIENALYTYLYGNVFQVIGRYMKGEAARQLTELFDSYIDLLNYVRILRLKFTYRSGTDFIRSTLFPYGAFRKKLLNEVLAAESKEQIDAALAKTSIGRQIAKTEYNYVDEIPNRVKYKTCRRDIRFSTHPSVVMMSYIFLTQCEIYDIITIVEGIRYQLPPDEIEKLLTVIRFDPV